MKKNVFQKLAERAGRVKQIRTGMRLIGKTLLSAAGGWESAKTNRRTYGLNRMDGDANTYLNSDLQYLRERSRYVVANSAKANTIIRTLTNNVIGANGINPRPDAGDNNELERKVRALWDEFAANCYAGNKTGWNGLTETAVRSKLVDGGVLIRKRIRRTSDGYLIPLQLQLLEDDYIDTSVNFDNGTGPKTVDGVAYDSLGEVTGYWLYRNHPGSAYAYTQSSQFYSADDVLYFYDQTRPGQSRGIPHLSNVMIALDNADKYLDAEQVAKIMQSAQVGVIRSASGDESVGVNMSTVEGGSVDIADNWPLTDINGEPVEMMTAGMFHRLTPDTSIEFSPARQNSGIKEYCSVIDHDIAAGVGLTYELLTGDLSGTNYSSIRHGRIEFIKANARRQRNTIDLLCKPVWGWFMDVCEATGKVTPEERALINVIWDLPENEAIDRKSEAEADLSEMRNGTMTLIEAIAKRGKDPEAVLDEHKKTLDMLTARGLSYDSIPALMTMNGMHQKAEVNNGN